MRKFLAAAAALCLVSTLLCGCRGNVSDRQDGRITDPTGTAATMPGTDTYPSYSTQPTESTSPDTFIGGNEDNRDTTNGTDTTENAAGNARRRGTDMR